MATSSSNKSSYRHYLPSSSPPRLRVGHVKSIKRLLLAAYNCCFQNEPISTESGGEICVTNLMIEFMKSLKNDTQFSSLIFDVSDKKYRKFGEKLKNQMPDISIDFKPSWCYPSLTIEAKIIKSDKQLFRNYCTKGIQRFVDLNYSSWWSDAFMIAYVRDDTTFEDFNNYLDGRRDIIQDCQFANYPELLTIPSLITHNNVNIRKSIHNRNNLKPITIWHLWLYKPTI